MGGRTRTSWKPGQSGNPKGRPKKELTIAEWIRKELKKVNTQYKKTYLELFAMAVVADAIKGDPTARKLIMQYIDGLPTQKISFGDGSDEIKVKFEMIKKPGKNFKGKENNEE